MHTSIYKEIEKKNCTSLFVNGIYLYMPYFRQEIAVCPGGIGLLDSFPVGLKGRRFVREDSPKDKAWATFFEPLYDLTLEKLVTFYTNTFSNMK